MDTTLMRSRSLNLQKSLQLKLKLQNEAANVKTRVVNHGWTNLKTKTLLNGIEQSSHDFQVLHDLTKIIIQLVHTLHVIHALDFSRAQHLKPTR